MLSHQTSATTVDSSCVEIREGDQRLMRDIVEGRALTRVAANGVTQCRLFPLTSSNSTRGQMLMGFCDPQACFHSQFSAKCLQSIGGVPFLQYPGPMTSVLHTSLMCAKQFTTSVLKTCRTAGCNIFTHYIEQHTKKRSSHMTVTATAMANAVNAADMTIMMLVAESVYRRLPP